MRTRCIHEAPVTADQYQFFPVARATLQDVPIGIGDERRAPEFQHPFASHAVGRCHKHAVRDGVAGTLVLEEDGGRTWFPQGNPQRPLDADLAYSIHVGRRLLGAFNDNYPGDFESTR